MSETIMLPNPVAAPPLLAVCSNPFCVAGIDCPKMPKKCPRCGWTIGKVPDKDELMKLGKKWAE